MKNNNFFNYSCVLLLILFIYNCKSDKANSESIKDNKKTPPIIEVVTRAMDFASPDTIPSGWNTFKYYNLSK